MRKVSGRLDALISAWVGKTERQRARVGARNTCRGGRGPPPTSGFAARRVRNCARRVYAQSKSSTHHLGTVATGTDTGASRQRFLRLTAGGAGTLALGALVAAGAPRGGLSGTSQSRDAEILNYALILEELTAAFYARAVAGGALSGELADFAEAAAAHEREHVEVIRGALGSKARPAPRFTFGKAVTSPARFAQAASELEELAVAAYNGQAANLSKPALQVAARIVSVDARHAAWIRAIRGRPPASQATDEPKTRRQVLVQVDRTGFVRS